MSPAAPPSRDRTSPDLERARELLGANGGRLGAPFHVLSSTGSTNDDAKAGAKEGAPHGAVWLAEEQSAGRGRQGRTWTAARGESLLFSVLLRLACPPARVPLVSLVAGLAVRDAVAKALSGVSGVSGAQVLVKWPNDVVVRDAGVDRKVAGILVESSLMGAKVEHVVVGIGLNVHTRMFPLELAAIATSVALAGGRDPDRGQILADVLAGLDHDVEHVVHRGLSLVLGRLQAADSLLAKPLASEDGSVVGDGAGIDPEGRLILRQGDGTLVKVSSGEVRLRTRS